MKAAHIRSMLAALLLAAGFGAIAEPSAKVSPLDGMPFGSARSEHRPFADLDRTAVRDLAAPGPGPSEAGPAGFFSQSRLDAIPKTVANGLTLAGSWNATWSGSNVTLTLTRINNDSSTRTSGTLRLELWAVSSPPPRATGFSGYRLAVFNTFDPLPPRTFYTDIVRSGTMNYPPDGTYWLVLVLAEFDSVNCSQSDRFCIQDTSNSNGTSTFGPVAPPPPPPPPPPPVSSGVETTSLGARATVSGSATAFGGFSVVNNARVYILVRGNSLGTLGVTQAFMDAPRVRLYNAAGSDLVTQAGMPGFNFCLASNTSTDLPVVQLYQGRGQPVHSRDSCYTTVLGAGTYTFSVTPSNGATSASASSSTFSGEVLFEVTLARP